jgi:hypothetical protein
MGESKRRLHGRVLDVLHLDQQKLPVGLLHSSSNWLRGLGAPAATNYSQSILALPPFNVQAIRRSHALATMTASPSIACIGVIGKHVRTAAFVSL